MCGLRVRVRETVAPMLARAHSGDAPVSVQHAGRASTSGASDRELITRWLKIALWATTTSTEQ
jgi:hypothetical protein